MLKISEYNRKTEEEIRERDRKKEHCNVACDECGEELMYSDNALLLSYPAKRNVHCPNCGRKYYITVDTQ